MKSYKLKFKESRRKKEFFLKKFLTSKFQFNNQNLNARIFFYVLKNKKYLFEFRAKKKGVNFICISANFGLHPSCVEAQLITPPRVL